MLTVRQGEFTLSQDQLFGTFWWPETDVLAVLAPHMARSVKEWRSDNHDASVPPRVRLRIFLKHNGICYLSGRAIRPGDTWQLDHIVSLVNGGEHIESNLAPVLVEPHKEKTAKDIKEKAMVAKKLKSHLGIRAKKKKMGYKRFNGTVVKPRWG